MELLGKIDKNNFIGQQLDIIRVKDKMRKDHTNTFQGELYMLLLEEV